MHRQNFIYLFAGLIALLAIEPTLETVSPHSGITQITFTLILVVGVWSLQDSRHWFRWGLGMTGIAVVFGYALLGATWLIMKTEDITQQWARSVASYALGFVGLFMAFVSISMPLLNEGIKTFWFSLPNFYYLLPIPLLTLGLFIMLFSDLYHGKREYRPFLLSIGVFLMVY